jgi:type IV pilus assembly protein PilA
MGERGFTLIEMMVVTLIIGVLAAIAIPRFLNETHKAHDASAKSDVRNAVTQMESCFTEDETYIGCTTTYAAISAQTTSGYVATKISDSGNTFEIMRAGGSYARRCDVPPGNDRGGCSSDDSW